MLTKVLAVTFLGMALAHAGNHKLTKRKLDFGSVCMSNQFGFAWKYYEACVVGL